MKKTKRCKVIEKPIGAPAIVHNNVMSALQTEFDKMKYKYCRIQPHTSSCINTQAYRDGYDGINWGTKYC